MHFLRKHRHAFIAVAVYHFVFFFPTLFMARIPSPNDVFFNYDPWSHVRHHDVQNSVMNDPPTAYFTLMSLLKSDRQAFNWNPFVASGIPGFGSSASAVLSPFVAIPALALPLGWVYAGIILLKLNVAFVFAYGWLREERLGRRGAAVGAIVIAASGAYAVRWWWQATNATALYPALLWIVARAARGRRVPVWSVTLIALAYALAGFPAAMAYGAYLAIAYAVWRACRCGLQPALDGLKPVPTFLLGVAIASPAIVPFVQFLKRSGYLVARANNAVSAFPLRHLLLFIQPERLGNNAYHTWRGDPALGAANNFVGATIYLGLIPLVLMVVALWNRRARQRWFWFATLLVTLACMFGLKPISVPIAHLPLLRYSAMMQFVLLLPLPVGYLAAAAISRRHAAIASVAAALCAADLAVFAGRSYPYITHDIAVPPMTPTIAYLQQQPKPFRIAAFTNYLWPNTAELYRLEDVRSHFSSEADYRLILKRIDPTSSSDQHTVILFDYLKFNFADPLTGMLGIRYYLEHRDIDILRWTVFKESTPGVPATGVMTIMPGGVVQRHFVVDQQPFYALEMPVTLRSTTGQSPRLVVTLTRGTDLLFQRAFTPADINAINKVYVPVYEHLRRGDTALIQVRSIGMRVEMLMAAAAPGDGPLFYDRVKVPLIFDREMPDGRIYRNAGEVPRFHSVSRLSKMTHDEFLANTANVDFREEAVLTGSDAPMDSADAEVRLRRYDDDRQIIDVNAPAGTFLASSEKLTPELRIAIDGREAKPVEINLLFAGVRVPAGKHVVVFSRRVGRGWWWVSGLAAFFAVALSISDAVRRR